ncbi:MAG: Ribosomal RNA small subunit methyltransferase A [Chroococcopsis gigantea SAG 12.99]|jgi:16S rRNA (adenine1518-N6/adenine1519-N6)-dimethyltransferase|nr:16S rRNA (adenine(1518)-N(6)/adenine(1519)-N(6))-dimethyltransferase RsmA [Chlorogloea purpurea SAG 13.99]MDV2999702.1 Ribosomal RNA small subunit methyltransferase A [Chroococcopsis gigantea SAG 12.99]
MTIRPRKHFGQHWLKSEIVLEQIVDAARIEKNDRILEIGPGTGILTKRLLECSEGVTAVEIDRDLCERLARSLGKKSNFLLLQGDFLTLDLEQCLEKFPAFRPLNKVVANIPYNITSPILEKLLGSIVQPQRTTYESIVLLIQKEVAGRLCAIPSTKAYGALSIRIQYLAAVEWICDVSSRAFSPPPEVDSAVVRLTPRTYPKPLPNPKKLNTLIDLGFASRRKMLRNNLKSQVDPEKLSQILEQLNINPLSRAEDLSLDQWIDLCHQITE